MKLPSDETLNLNIATGAFTKDTTKKWYISMHFSEQPNSIKRTDKIVSLDKSIGKSLVENIDLGFSEEI